MWSDWVDRTNATIELTHKDLKYPTAKILKILVGEVIFCVYIEQMHDINSISLQIFRPFKEKKHDQ